MTRLHAPPHASPRCSRAAFVFVRRYVPETRGRTPEQIGEALDRRFGRTPWTPAKSDDVQERLSW